jgi:hypothetical protein
MPWFEYSESKASDEIVTEKLRMWVTTHPQPDVPIRLFMGVSFTPRQVFDEVEHRTPFGQEVLGFLNYAARKYEADPASFLDRAIEAGTSLAEQ